MEHTQKNDKRLDEEKRLKKELVEGYKARREEDAEMNEEWEATTLERW